MSLAIDILIVAFLALGGWAGWKAGVLKTLVKLIGLVAIVILSYTLRGYVMDTILDYAPFFNYGGIFNEVYSINIFVYNAIVFLVIFILLYCILNIVIALTGFIDTLLKFTVIWIIPSKIGGAILGVLEAWIFIVLAASILGQITVTSTVVFESNIAPFMLNHTPVVSKLVGSTASSMKDVIDLVKEGSDDRKGLDLSVLQKAINAGIITKEKAQEFIDTEKFTNMEGVMFG